MKNRNIFRLFSCCQIVQGHSRALLMDTQRGAYFTIPLGLSNMLVRWNNHTIEEVINNYSEVSEREIIREYFDFLLENEVVFICSESIADRFPEINYDFDFPATISNAVVQINSDGLDTLTNILDQLIELECFAIDLTVADPISEKLIQEVLDICEQAEIEDLFLSIAEINSGTIHETYKELKSRFPFLTSIVVFGSDLNDTLYDSDYNIKVVYTEKDLSNHLHCGIVSENYFTPSMDHYTESLHHNSCLNRKISVDAEGNIRNCPSMNVSYGNIKNTTLREVIEMPDFKKYWNIAKDQISICRDCEFRHVCTDCRAYVEEPSDDYSKPLKCGYNPYTCEWEEWSTHPMKQKAIDHYGMRHLIKQT